MSNVLLLDMAIHTFDAARFLSGADPVSVYCEEYNPSWSWYEGASCANALFEMSDGLRFTYRGGWSAEGAPYLSWEMRVAGRGQGGRSATWDGHGAPIVEVVTAREGFFSPTEQRTRAVPEREHVGIAGSLRDFIAALRTGTTPMGECHDNIKSLGMVFAAIESAAAGKRVPIEV